MNKLIIHFTSQFETIIQILLSNSFLLSYSKEDFYLGDKKVSSAAHPMVCFSYFDTVSLKTMKSTYGSYGIGFSKDWALKKKLNPVFYINQNSITASALANLLKARRNNEELNDSKLKQPIMILKCFTKNVRGFNSYFNQMDFDFQKENEWRFVPDKHFIGGKYISVNQSRYKSKQDYYNKQLKVHPFKFKMNEIEMILVMNKFEKEELLKMGIRKEIIRINQH